MILALEHNSQILAHPCAKSEWFQDDWRESDIDGALFPILIDCGSTHCLQGSKSDIFLIYLILMGRDREKRKFLQGSWKR
jgi:hypothetical protein